jgi:dTDP-4-dehydrorhamnose reductase
MKILVTGAAGMLGQDVWKLFGERHDLIGLDRVQAPGVDSAHWRSCDLTNAAQTYDVITKANPEVVVHCAAYNNVDAAEANPDDAFRGNAIATRNVALACQRFDAALIHLSTDQVFDGKTPPTGGYREFDPCSPLCRYGESKYWAEVFVQKLLNKFFIVRTSWLYGPGRTTWADQVAMRSRDGQPIQAVSDMVSSPTYTPDLAAALLTLAESRRYGLYHLTNGGFCSRVQWAEEILRLHHREGYAALQKMTRAQLKLPAYRPEFSALNNLAWRLDGFTPLRSWKEALREHFENKKEKPL